MLIPGIPLPEKSQKECGLTNIDINALFSVIFKLTVFSEIYEYGKSLFVSRYHFRSRCRFCQIELQADNEFHGSQR